MRNHFHCILRVALARPWAPTAFDIVAFRLSFENGIPNIYTFYILDVMGLNLFSHPDQNEINRYVGNLPPVRPVKIGWIGTTREASQQATARGRIQSAQPAGGSPAKKGIANLDFKQK